MSGFPTGVFHSAFGAFPLSECRREGNGMTVNGLNHFVELNRTFHEVSSKASDDIDDDVDVLRAFRFRRTRLTWADLRNEYRVVILSEAGAGKTVEIHQTAAKLRSEGKQAFFVRLEHVVEDFEYAFEVGTFEEFKSWLDSSADGWLFLDSVDEARLRDPRDFELAIRKVSGKIDSAMQRARIVITSRDHAWRSKSDLEHCVRHLPIKRSTTPQVNPPATPADDPHFELLDDVDEGQVSTSSPFKIVALDDLESEQIKAFVTAKSVKKTKEFLDAVARADAKTFTTRPQDLEELAELWNSDGEIGTRYRILENSIDRRLKERDPGRSEMRSLPPARAREGARLVAAAVMMSKKSLIRTPDSSEAAKGISIAEILPTWTNADRTTLLSYPIFDEAIYGSVRFHHRSVREFLTAEWLAKLLTAETSRRRIEALLFQKQYGIDVVVPTMRPVLPWLAIHDQKIRDRLLQVAPDLLVEGGDPRMLPLDVRRSILRRVCEEIATSTFDKTHYDYSSVQRFAKADIAPDISALLAKYASHDELVGFLMRMIWHGELAECLSGAKACAIASRSSEYTRIAAIRAMQAIKASKELDVVRSWFSRKKGRLSRNLLAELLTDLEPSTQNAKWLNKCLARIGPRDDHRTDPLVDEVVEYVQRADVTVLSQIVPALCTLLNIAPAIDPYHSDISEEFGWLMRASAHAVRKLIEVRHPAALENAGLDILQKCSMWHPQNFGDYRNEKIELAPQVVAWPELNRALFWFAVAKTRIQRSAKRGDDRLTDYRYAMYNCSCAFDVSDFEYAVAQITSQPEVDDKLVALSLAFWLYTSRGRKGADRSKLKNGATTNPAVEEQLGRFFLSSRKKPRSSSKWESAHRRKCEAHRRKADTEFAKWKEYVRQSADKLQDNGMNPGQLSQLQWDVHEFYRENEDRSVKRNQASWKRLVEQFGKSVAEAFRIGAKQFWRGHRPKLRSEDPQSTEYSCHDVFGLTGIYFEFDDDPERASTFSPDEIELACRYASFECGGLPDWFPKLFAGHSSCVAKFLLQEIEYEASAEPTTTSTSYILGNISWSGQWCWDRLAPRIVEMLKANDPKNVAILGHLLTIVQGSMQSDAIIAEVASRRCATTDQVDHLAHWLAVWAGVDPEHAIPALAARLKKSTRDDRLALAMNFLMHLIGDRHINVPKVRSRHRTATHLQRLYYLMHQYISKKDDVVRDRSSSNSSTLRRDAQEARDRLPDLISEIPGKESFIALRRIARRTFSRPHKGWFDSKALSRAERDADVNAWTPSQVYEFNDELERTPSNHRDLAELIDSRFRDLKDDLEHGDSSIAGILLRAECETDLRKYFGGELRSKSRQRYSVPQEEELADAKRPDLRIHGVGFDAPVPCELKLADNWPGPKLFERMENQLCGDYLRDRRSARGIFILVNRKKDRRWKISRSKKSVGFDGLIDALERHWEKISDKFPGVDSIEVIGIDLTKRTR